MTTVANGNASPVLTTNDIQEVTSETVIGRFEEENHAAEEELTNEPVTEDFPIVEEEEVKTVEEPSVIASLEEET